MADATPETPAIQEFKLDAIFMRALYDLLNKLQRMYPKCKTTQRHVQEFNEHHSDPGVIRRSVNMWHKVMQPFYIDIAQTKNEERVHRAIRQCLEKNWFFSQMSMQKKWDRESFAPSRPGFVREVRYVNGLAFLQNSFLGRLSSVFQELAAHEDPMSNVGNFASKVLKHITADAFDEISRMLPHVIHILGGMDQFDTLLDQALSAETHMKPVIQEMLSSFVDTEEIGDVHEVLEGSKDKVKEVITRLADPDNENSLYEVVGEIRGEKLSKEQLAEAFDSLKETFSEDMVNNAVSAVTMFATENADASLDEISEAARLTLTDQGLDISETQFESMRNAAKALLSTQEGD